MVIRDTAQFHYETIVDEVISVHNEDLLSELTVMIRDPHHLTSVLRPQTEYLGLTSISDICIVQMPGSIANEIHELSKEIYSSVSRVVAEYWTSGDNYYRKVVLNSMEEEREEELAAAIEISNMKITDSIMDVIDNFDFISRVKNNVMSCQNMLYEEDIYEEDSLTQKLWTAILSATKAKHDESLHSINVNRGFLYRYLQELTSDLQTQLNGRVYDLASNINEDLTLV
ncbi:hypothetical protein K501DRAFT_289660 [Backusella circina FSU 941]|nr:hypothetical protein K501DRAFT_289660 [Backusella circina FSU 941]